MSSASPRRVVGAIPGNAAVCLPLSNKIGKFHLGKINKQIPFDAEF